MQRHWNKKYYYALVIGLIITIIALFSAIYFTRQNAVNQTSDTYKDFNDLKHHTTQNKDWKISTKHVKNDNILITAIHGGGIEPGSTEIARRIANIGKYDFYSFQGLLPADNQRLHITSTNYDEPQLMNMLAATKETISVHGFNGEDPLIYIGGKDKYMAKAIRTELRKAGFTIKSSPKGIEAMSEDNFVNQNGTDTGVQLELTTKQRQLFFKDLKLDKTTRNNSDNYTHTFYKFAKAVHKGIEKAK